MHPKGMPTLDCFRNHSGTIHEPNEGEVLVQTLYLSVDPYMRGSLGGRISSHPPFILNYPINGDGIGRVISSKSNEFQEGDFVIGTLDWAEYSTKTAHSLQKVSDDKIPLTAYLGPLGMTGMTAYFGITLIGALKAGETVLISAAGGAVGMFAASVAKAHGCQVVGITGSDWKADRLVKECSFDAAVNYTRSTFTDDLKRVCPRGVDVYFDNVGGKVTDAALELINKFARIILSGQISTYNGTGQDIGLRPFRTLIVNSARAQGFVVWDYKARFPEGMREMLRLVKEEKIKWQESILDGLEMLPHAFLGLFSGDNFGKQLVKIT